jgi:hypothetical protein
VDYPAELRIWAMPLELIDFFFLLVYGPQALQHGRWNRLIVIS